jgi:hypothetical protein
MRCQVSCYSVVADFATADPFELTLEKADVEDASFSLKENL